MSGAEALAGVSLVCNVIQIVTFVRDVIITYKSIEDNHSPDPCLAQMCEAVKEPYDQLLRDTEGHLGPMGEEQQALVQGAQKCVERIEELSRMVSRLSVPANSSRPLKTMKIIGRSISSLWRKKELSALEKDLERYQALVDTHLLRHISGNVRSLETQNLRSFAELDDRLKQLLNSYRTDNTAIQGFISEQSEKTQECVKETGTHIKTHVDRQLAVTEQVIRSDLTTLETYRLDERTRAKQEERRKRVLESLYFPERTSRWNRIEENYPKTFRWILSIPGDPQSENDDDYSDDSNSQEDESDDSNSQGSVSEESWGVYHNDEDEIDSESEEPTATAFAPWLRSESKLFWISGKPASGKSTLMKYIITNPKTLKHLQEWQRNVHIIHHFFWKPGSSMENSVDGMLCSLLYQILESQPSLVESIRRHGLDPAAKRSHHDWSTKELKDTLFRLLKEADASFCIFLDGLDEAVEKLHKFEIKSLLDGLMQSDCVKVCASGRPEPKFSKYFAGTKQLAIHDLTSKDIKRLVNSRLKGMQLDPVFRSDLALIVVDRAQGVFMWVILVLNSVEMNIERETPEECLERVSRMAQDLHSLYRDMWTRATYHGIDRATATLYFNLIVKRRLSLFSGVGDEDHNSWPTAFIHTTLLELAMMADEDFLTSFFEDYDSVTATQLLDLVQNTKQRVELGTAGLLECSAGRDVFITDDTNRAPLEKIGVYALDVVDFTHRTVFDFFTDSEYGRDILLGSSVTYRQFFTRCFRSVVLICHYLQTPVHGFIINPFCRSILITSPVAEIIRLVGGFEAYDPEISETANEMVKTLREWNLKGHFNSTDWKIQHRVRFALPEETAAIQVVEVFEALTDFRPRMATRFTQELRAPDLSNALPAVLDAGNDTRDHSEWFYVVRALLSRLSELRDAGEYARHGDLSRETSLALSFFLRKLFFILHHYSSRPKKLKHIHGILRNAAETMEWFTKLDISNHCWGRSFITPLHLDFGVDGNIYWYLGRPSDPPSILLACNDLFLKQFLATQEGLRGLQDWGKGEACGPVFEVLLVCNECELHPAPWAKPSAPWARKMENLLAQTLTGRRSFLSVKDQYEELFKQVEVTDTYTSEEEFERWEKEILAELEDDRHFQHPWMPVKLS